MATWPRDPKPIPAAPPQPGRQPQPKREDIPEKLPQRKREK